MSAYLQAKALNRMPLLETILRSISNLVHGMTTHEEMGATDCLLLCRSTCCHRLTHDAIRVAAKITTEMVAEWSITVPFNWSLHLIQRQSKNAGGSMAATSDHQHASPQWLM